jgi:hypothetical protein
MESDALSTGRVARLAANLDVAFTGIGSDSTAAMSPTGSATMTSARRRRSPSMAGCVALLERQRAFRRRRIVADGRDMGTVVFPTPRRCF